MKNTLVVLLLFSVWNVFSQKNEDSLASKERPGMFWFFTGLSPAGKNWKPKYDRLIVDIKYNDLVNPANVKLFNTAWNSIGFNTQFIFDFPLNTKGTTSFGIGLGYEFSKFIHNQAVLPFSNKNYDFADTSYFNKSILRTHTFFIPIEFRLRTKGWQHFKFHIGSNIGYRFGNNKTYQSDKTDKLRMGKIHNFQWLYLDLHARVGIRNWAIIASANMLPIFTKTTNRYFPVSLGVSISLF